MAVVPLVGRWGAGRSCLAVHAMQAVPPFPGRALLENPDLALEGTLGEERGWDLLPRGRTTWARSVIHVPYLQPCFPLRGSCGGPQAAPTWAFPQCPLDCRVGTHVEGGTSKGGHSRPAGESVPWQVTQQKEAGGRKGGQLSPCHQMGASQHAAGLKDQGPAPHTLGHFPPRWKVRLTDL